MVGQRPGEPSPGGLHRVDGRRDIAHRRPPHPVTERLGQPQRHGVAVDLRARHRHRGAVHRHRKGARRRRQGVARIGSVRPQRHVIQHHVIQHHVIQHHSISQIHRVRGRTRPARRQDGTHQRRRKAPDHESHAVALHVIAVLRPHHHVVPSNPALVICSKRKPPPPIPERHALDHQACSVLSWRRGGDFVGSTKDLHLCPGVGREDCQVRVAWTVSDGVGGAVGGRCARKDRAQRNLSVVRSDRQDELAQRRDGPREIHDYHGWRACRAPDDNRKGDGVRAPGTHRVCFQRAVADAPAALARLARLARRAVRKPILGSYVLVDRYPVGRARFQCGVARRGECPKGRM